MKYSESSLLFIIQDIMLGSTKGNICRLNAKNAEKQKKQQTDKKISNIANPEESLHN